MKTLLALVLISLGLGTTSALAQNAPPKQDTSGKGAILCAYDIYHSVRATTKACQWEPNATDDAIDAGLVDIETFIRANSSDDVPIQTMEWIKRRNSEQPIPPGMLDQCTGFDPENRGSSMAFVWMLRNQHPDQVKASIEDMLSLPREPLYNPCL